MISFVHSADIHLGHGSDARQADIMNAFARLVDYTLANQVPVLVIAGDMFNHIRPAYGTLGQAIVHVNRLTSAGIHVLIVGGNHDTPKTEGVSSPLEVLAHLSPLVTVAITEYKPTLVGDTVFHLMPYYSKKADLTSALDRAVAGTIPNQANVLVAHLSVGSIARLAYDEASLDDKELSALSAKFDYIALGHYHGRWREGKAAYSGSLEHLTFNELGDVKGWALVNDAGPTFVDACPRPMIELPTVDLSSSSKPTDDIIAAIKAADIGGKLVRMKVVNVPALLYRAIDFRQLRQAVNKAANPDDVFVFAIKEDAVHFTAERAAFKDILVEWREYTAEAGLGADIQAAGSEYLTKGGGT